MVILHNYFKLEVCFNEKSDSEKKYKEIYIEDHFKQPQDGVDGTLYNDDPENALKEPEFWIRDCKKKGNRLPILNITIKGSLL